jgi:hypothetical protein
MYSVRGVAASVLTAAVVASLCAPSTARADNFQRDDDTFLLFAGIDLWRHGHFSHGGLLWSPDGLDREGFTFKTLIGSGLYRYRTDALGDVIGHQAIGFVMPGWRFIRDNTFVTVFAGLDVQDHRLTKYDPGNRLRGTHVGLRGAIEFWHEPDARTMLAFDASVSSIGISYAARAAFGWRLFDAFYVGPEVGGFAAGESYRQFRTGLHLTGLRWNFIEWSFAGGWATDSDDRAGPYARFGMTARR